MSVNSQMIVVRPRKSEVFELDKEKLELLIYRTMGIEPPSQKAKALKSFTDSFLGAYLFGGSIAIIKACGIKIGDVQEAMPIMLISYRD